MWSEPTGPLRETPTSEVRERRAVFHVKHSREEESELYQLPAAAAAETEAKGSRFIARIVPADSRQAVREFLAAERARFPDATHIAYAYIIGPHASQESGISDDGEPQGTAGRPIYDALFYSSVTNVLGMVTRYFGGTKLGTGGLVRAYGSAVRAALEGATLERLRVRVPVRVRMPYRLADSTERLLGEFDVTSLQREFGEDVLFRFEIPLNQRDSCAARIRDLSSGLHTLEQENGDDVKNNACDRSRCDPSG